ncbi:hypothetical protein TNCV_1854111 [Trichonephila clavipes]|nr:hypothetical protein TNCV_1854111 [Trichonephila clavipes]
MPTVSSTPAALDFIADNSIAHVKCPFDIRRCHPSCGHSGRVLLSSEPLPVSSLRVPKFVNGGERAEMPVIVFRHITTARQAY